MSRRLCIWMIETVAEVPLLGFVILLVGEVPVRHGASDVAALFALVVFFMVYSGYLITTCAFGILLRGRVTRSYPLIACGLLIIHDQGLVLLWDLPQREHLKLQILGAIVVAVCTLVGNRFLHAQ